MLEADDLQVVGSPETPFIVERVVVAPSDGRFHPLPPDVFTSEGEWVRIGQALAEIRLGERVIPVVSLFEGWVMGMLAIPGQPVKERDPLFWICP